MTIIITITECYGERKTSILRARTESLDVAINRAIRKAYGAKKYFCRDNSISIGNDALNGSQYGQIGHSVGNETTSLDTGRVCITAEKA